MIRLLLLALLCAPLGPLSASAQEDKPADTPPPAEKPADKPAEKPADKPADKPAKPAPGPPKQPPSGPAPGEGDDKKGDDKKGDAKKGDPKKGDPKKGDPKKGDPKKGDPEKADQPKQIDPAEVQRLLALLDHSRYREREKATAMLYDLGPGVVPHLEKYVQGSPSVEARRRAESIVQRIALEQHWASFKGGEIVGGLQATLRCDRSTYLVGEPIKLKLEVKNTTGKVVKCVHLQTLDAKLPSGDSQNPSSSGKLVLKAIRVKNSGMSGSWSSRSSGGTPTKPTDLAAGKTRARSFSLREYLPSWGGSGDLEPGIYEIKITLFTKKILKLPKDLQTNAIRIQISTKR